jgi:hypothetical protein
MAYLSEAARAIGMTVLRTPKRCECGKLTWLTSKHRTRVCCYECVVTEAKTTTSRPFKAMCSAALALALLVICGCQAPREFRAEAQVCGQVVKCEIRK